MSQKINESSILEIGKEHNEEDTRKDKNEDVTEFVEEKSDINQNKKIILTFHDEINKNISEKDNLEEEIVESKNVIEKQTENENFNCILESNTSENEKNKINLVENSLVENQKDNLRKSFESKDNPEKYFIEFTNESNNHFQIEDKSQMKQNDEKNIEYNDGTNKNVNISVDVFEFTEPNSNINNDFENQISEGDFKKSEPESQPKSHSESHLENKEKAVNLELKEEAQVKDRKESGNEIEFNETVEENKIQSLIESHVYNKNKENVDFEFSENKSNQSDNKEIEFKIFNEIENDESKQNIKSEIKTIDHFEQINQQIQFEINQVEEKPYSFPAINDIKHSINLEKNPSNEKDINEEFEFKEVEEKVENMTCENKFELEDIKISENKKSEQDFEFNEVVDEQDVITKENNEQIIDNNMFNANQKVNSDSDDFEFNDVKENDDLKSSFSERQNSKTKFEKNDAEVNRDIDLEFNDAEEQEQEQQEHHEFKQIDSLNHEKIEENQFEKNKQHIEEDFDFNQVEEVSNIGNVEISNKINNEILVQENKIEEDDFEFNEVEENQDDCKNNLNLNLQSQPSETFIQNNINKSKSSVEGKPEKISEFDDEFDFVEEEENTIQLELEQETDDNNPKESASDDFDFVDEAEESPQDSQTKLNPLDQASNQIQFPKIYIGKNSDIISNLFLQFKENYSSGLLPVILYTKPVSDSQPQQIPSKENIENFNLDIDKSNMSLKNIISSIPKFKLEPEINIRSLKVEEITSLPKNFDNLKKNIKGLKLQSTFSEFSNTSIKKLYFKYIDLKNIFQNSQNVVMSESSYKDSNKNLVGDNNLKEFTEEISNFSFNENSNKKNNKYLSNSEDPNLNSEEFNEVEEGGHIKTVLNSNIKLEISSKQKSSALDEIQIPEENEDFNFDNPKSKSSKIVKNKIEIDQALYSIVAPIENYKNEHISEKMDENIDNTEQVSSSQPGYDEDKMIEMLKQLSKNKDSDKNKPDIREEQINDEEFCKVIAALPNYNFMLSRFVEYPDSLFNI